MSSQASTFGASLGRASSPLLTWHSPAVASSLGVCWGSPPPSLASPVGAGSSVGVEVGSSLVQAAPPITRRSAAAALSEDLRAVVRMWVLYCSGDHISAETIAPAPHRL